MGQRPTLIVVSGPAGSGKTTLAHELARALGCPAICRDEIKQGMARATPGYLPSPGDPLSLRTFAAFFDVLRVLLAAGVTVVAEAAFQDRLWRPGLERLSDLAEIRIVRCTVDASLARARITERVGADPSRAAHDDLELLRALESGESSIDSFVPISLDVPTLDVDTTNGHVPGLAEIVAFADHGPSA